LRDSQLFKDTLNRLISKVQEMRRQMPDRKLANN